MSPKLAQSDCERESVSHAPLMYVRMSAGAAACCAIAAENRKSHSMSTEKRLFTLRLRVFALSFELRNCSGIDTSPHSRRTRSDHSIRADIQDAPDHRDILSSSDTDMFPSRGMAAARP